MTLWGRSPPCRANYKREGDVRGQNAAKPCFSAATRTAADGGAEGWGGGAGGKVHTEEALIPEERGFGTPQSWLGIPLCNAGQVTPPL